MKRGPPTPFQSLTDSGYLDQPCTFCKGYDNVASEQTHTGMECLGTYKTHGWRKTETTSIIICENHFDMLDDLFSNMKRGLCDVCKREKTYAIGTTTCLSCIKLERCSVVGCIDKYIMGKDDHKYCKTHARMFF